MVKKSTKKQVSNEKLASMIAEGFSDVTSRMATKDDLQKVEDRLIKVEDRLTAVEVKLDKTLYKKIDRLEARIKKLEETVGIS